MMMQGELAIVHFLGGCAGGESRRVRVYPVLRVAPAATLRPPPSDPNLPAPPFADTYHVSPIGNSGEYEALCRVSGSYA